MRVRFSGGWVLSEAGLRDCYAQSKKTVFSSRVLFFRYASTVGFFIGSISGGGYLLRKASHWQPMEEIIRQKMDRAEQRDLISLLLTVCSDLNLVWHIQITKLQTCKFEKQTEFLDYNFTYFIENRYTLYMLTLELWCILVEFDVVLL